MALLQLHDDQGYLARLATQPTSAAAAWRRRCSWTFAEARQRGATRFEVSTDSRRRAQPLRESGHAGNLAWVNRAIDV